MNEVTIETIKRVCINKEGVFLEIGPDADTGTALEIRTISQTSKAWFGDIRFILDKELALKLAQALNDLAKDMP